MYEDLRSDDETVVRPGEVRREFSGTGEALPGEVLNLEALIWAGELAQPDPERVPGGRRMAKGAGIPDSAFTAADRLMPCPVARPDMAPRAPPRSIESPDAAGPAQPHRAAVALNALGNAARLEVFRLVAAEGRDGLTPEAVAGALEISRRDALKQLSILRRARLIHEMRHSRGRSIFVADTAAVRDCLTFIHELAGLLRAA